ncbi:hypothetical protein V2J09_006676 [Rumex salicifolius]
MASSCCSTALLPFKASNQSQGPSSSSSSIWVSSTNGSFHHSISRSKNMQSSFSVKAAKLPAGVEMPKVQPKFKPPFAGFTRVAETWNSRACMIGLIGTFIVELSNITIPEMVMHLKSEDDSKHKPICVLLFEEAD